MIWDRVETNMRFPGTITARGTTAYDLMDAEVRQALDDISRKIRRGEINPDDGTLEDIDWINKYPEFGRFVTIYKPSWNKCDTCGCLRLCFCGIVDLTYTCYKCQTEKGIMECLNKSIHLDAEPVKKFLNDGVVDPTVSWKSYQELYNEEMERFHELKAMDSLMLPFNREEKERLAQKLFSGININACNQH